MNRVTFDSKSFLKTDSFRSLASHSAAKSAYVAKSTRNLKPSKLVLSSIKPKVTVDYLGLLSPKSDKIEIIEPIEPKDLILETHNIKDLISTQEQKRIVSFIKDIFSDSSDTSCPEAFSSLSKLLSCFRAIEAKVIKN